LAEDQHNGYDRLRGSAVLKRGPSELVDPTKREKEQY